MWHTVSWDTVYLRVNFNSNFPGCSLNCGTQMTPLCPGRSCFRRSKALMVCSACWQRRLMQSCWMLQVWGQSLSRSNDECNENPLKCVCVFMFGVLLQVPTWRSSVQCQWVLTISLWRSWRKGDHYLSFSLKHSKKKDNKVLICVYLCVLCVYWNTWITLVYYIVCNVCVCVFLQRDPCGLYPWCSYRFCRWADCGSAAHYLQEAHRGHTWSQDVMLHTHTHTHPNLSMHDFFDLVKGETHLSFSLSCQWWLGHMENSVAVWIWAGQQHCGYPGSGEDWWAYSIWNTTHDMHISFKIIKTAISVNVILLTQRLCVLRCGHRWAPGTFQSKEVHLHRHGTQAWTGQCNQCRVW